MPPGSDVDAVQALLGGGASSEMAMEEELQRQCADLEQKLRQDDLHYQNETLEVQLVQMQDDFESLEKDFTSMCGFLERQLLEKTEQLEEHTRAAAVAEGHADCLKDLLHFHEENGQLISSYWRAQCEKRDGSIKFLTLKLQEYTVPSGEYWARRNADVDANADDSGLKASSLEGQALQPPAASSSSTSAVLGDPVESPCLLAEPAVVAGHVPGAGSGAPLPSIGQSYQTLLDQHQELLREHQELEDESVALARDLEASELKRAAVDARVNHALNQQSQEVPLQEPVSPHAAALEASLEAECSRLRSELEASEASLAAVSNRGRGRLPVWAHRCVWRDELDVRAGQLERISLQFDATKRSLDAANEELQWQAASAEALRMRLADVMRAIQTEEAKTSKLRQEHRQNQVEVEELLKHWPPRQPTAAASIGPAGGGAADADNSPSYRGLPLVCQQAHWLLETIRRSGAARTAVATKDDAGAHPFASSQALISAATARLPEDPQAGPVRLTLL